MSNPVSSFFTVLLITVMGGNLFEICSAIALMFYPIELFFKAIYTNPVQPPPPPIYLWQNPNLIRYQIIVSNFNDMANNYSDNTAHPFWGA